MHKKKPEKMWSFAKPGGGGVSESSKMPNLYFGVLKRVKNGVKWPKRIIFFKKKNLPPFFLLKIASLMAETDFTLGPTSKKNKIPLLMVVICLELASIK